MTIIHTGNTTTTGFSVTSDATGNLVVKTGGSGGTTALTVDDNQIATFANQPVIPVPAFRALATVDQAISNATVTRVNLPNVMFDTNSWFDGTTDYRYTPQIAGYYFFRGLAVLNGTSMTTAVAYIQKNGSPYTLQTSRTATNTLQYIEVSSLVYLNGSTDYIDLAGYVAASSGTEFAVSVGNESWATSTLEGFLVRAA